MNKENEARNEPIKKTHGKSYCAFCSIKIKARVNLPFILIRTKHKRFLLEKSSIISCVLVCCVVSFVCGVFKLNKTRTLSVCFSSIKHNTGTEHSTKPQRPEHLFPVERILKGEKDLNLNKLNTNEERSDGMRGLI